MMMMLMMMIMIMIMLVMLLDGRLYIDSAVYLFPLFAILRGCVRS